jgi:ABC-type nitrate/sulfonate/bicarbonate transport system ATPase subunit
VLDEATSALDSEVEASIQHRAESRVMEGKTVLAIAHRLSTIAAMDRIIVLDQWPDRRRRQLMRQLLAQEWALRPLLEPAIRRLHRHRRRNGHRRVTYRIDRLGHLGDGMATGPATAPSSCNRRPAGGSG